MLCMLLKTLVVAPVYIDRKRSGFIDTSNIGEEYIRAYACTCASHS